MESVDVKDLLTTGENKVIEEIMETNPLFVRTLDDKEECGKYNTQIWTDRDTRVGSGDVHGRNCHGR